MNNFKKILFIMLILLFPVTILSQNQNQSDNEYFDSYPDDYFILYSENFDGHNIKIYLSKGQLSLILFNTRFKMNYNINIFPEELDKKIKEFVAKEEFAKFIENSKIEELIDKIKNSNMTNKEKLYIELWNIFRQMYTLFEKDYASMKDIIVNKLDEYIPYMKKSITIATNFIELDDTEILLNLYDLNNKVVFSLYNDYFNVIKLYFYPSAYDFSLILCHELIHQYQNKNDIEYKIFSEFKNDENSSKILCEIVNLLASQVGKQNLFDLDECYEFFWDFPSDEIYKNFVNEYKKGQMKILYGFQEAMAYAIIPVIYKLLNGDAIEDHIHYEILGDYWIKFFEWLNYDLFFSKISSISKIEFWTLYCKEYIEYCNYLINN